MTRERETDSTTVHARTHALARLFSIPHCYSFSESSFGRRSRRCFVVRACFCCLLCAVCRQTLPLLSGAISLRREKDPRADRPHSSCPYTTRIVRLFRHVTSRIRIEVLIGLMCVCVCVCVFVLSFSSRRGAGRKSLTLERDSFSTHDTHSLLEESESSRVLHAI